MGAFVLTSENYYSQEANKEYLSVSQYKQFVGTYGRRGCEFTALEELNGRWQQKKNSGMMIGSYVDSYVEGTLDKFKQENPEIFKKDGTLKADFTKAEQVIARIERDPFFMSTLAGEKQVIMTGELFGAKWKIKMRTIFLCSDSIRSSSRSYENRPSGLRTASASTSNLRGRFTGPTRSRKRKPFTAREPLAATGVPRAWT